MEKTKKLTYKIVIEEILKMGEVKQHKEYVEVLEKLLASLNKKSESRSKKNSEVDTKLTQEVLKILGEGEKLTITDLWQKSEILNAVSSNKVSSIVKKLKDTHQVIRTVEKKRAYFSLPNGDSDVE